MWACVRLARCTILWAAWLLPSLWVGGLWLSGLWDRLDLACWSCLAADGGLPAATKQYYVVCRAPLRPASASPHQ